MLFSHYACTGTNDFAWLVIVHLMHIHRLPRKEPNIAFFKLYKHKDTFIENLIMFRAYKCKKESIPSLKQP